MVMSFTGTRYGVTADHLATFNRIVDDFPPEEFHHGDCVGADAAAHVEIIKRKNILIKIHPPINPVNRAFCLENYPGSQVEELERDEYMVRNRHIVDAGELLVAMSKTREEILRSGTWSAIRYARKTAKRVIIIMPNGNIKEEIFC